MTKVIKEIVLKGYDHTNAKTKALVIWVSGEDSEIDRIAAIVQQHILYIEDIDIGFSVGDSLGIDFDLPKQELDFLSRVQEVLSADYS